MALTWMAATVAALVAAGCGGGDGTPSQDPGVVVSTLVRTLYRGESGVAWEWLHPQHRETVTRERYVECERRAPLVGELRRIAVLAVQDAQWIGPGPDEPG